MEPTIEFLWWRECPSWERALAMLRTEMAALEIGQDNLELIEVTDEARATELGFPGSPTIRVGGEDVVAPTGEETIGLSCRVYLRRDRRISPLPDPADVRAALQRAEEDR